MLPGPAHQKADPCGWSSASYLIACRGLSRPLKWHVIVAAASRLRGGHLTVLIGPLPCRPCSDGYMDKHAGTCSTKRELAPSRPGRQADAAALLDLLLLRRAVCVLNRGDMTYGNHIRYASVGRHRPVLGIRTA